MNNDGKESRCGSQVDCFFSFCVYSFLKLPIIYAIQQYHLIFLSMKELKPEAITINCIIVLFIMTYECIFSLHELLISGTPCLMPGFHHYIAIIPEPYFIAVLPLPAFVYPFLLPFREHATELDGNHFLQQ